MTAFVNNNSNNDLIFNQCLDHTSYQSNNNITDLLLCISNNLQAYVEESISKSLSNLLISNTTTLFSTNDTINSTSISDNNDVIDSWNDNDMNSSDSSSNWNRSIALIFASILVFMMQCGFAMICAGAVRKKNIQNTLLKNLLDACCSAISFYIVGYAFAFGNSDYNNPNKTFMGTSNFLLLNINDTLSFWLFNYTFSATSVTIIAGTLAERCQMAAYIFYSIFLTGWVYPIVAHTIWCPQGFLSPHSINPLWDTGMIDFAGASVVHVTGGATALFATIILGPRRGRFHDDEGNQLMEPKHFQGSNIALQMLGTFLLWFGWYGFNIGNAWFIQFNPTSIEVATLAAVNTTLAAAAGGLTSLLFNLWWIDHITGEGIFDLKYAMNGVLSGLVSITGGCGVVEPWAALIIGILSGINYTFASRLLLRLHIDDAVDAVPVHLFNGILSIIMTGLLASPTRLLNAYGRNVHVGLFYSWSNGQSDFVLLGIQLIGLLFVIGWVMFFMIPFFTWLDFMGWFRSDPLDEIVGLDTSYHGGLALLTTAHNNNNNSYDEVISDKHISEFKKQKLEAKKLRQRIIQSSNHNNNNIEQQKYQIKFEEDQNMIIHNEGGEDDDNVDDDEDN